MTPDPSESSSTDRVPAADRASAVHESPTTDRAFLAAATVDAEAVGFVAVGDRFDADLRYLTRFEGPEREYAFVRIAEGAAGTSERGVLCAPVDCADEATRQFDGRVATERAGDPAGERAAAVLDEALGEPAGANRSRTVLVPPTIPHDAAVYLERAGYDLRSTSAVAEARATKAAGEVEAIRAVQRAADRAVRRGERVLAAADRAAEVEEVEETAEAGADDRLRWRDAPLTAESLRREVNAELSLLGVSDAGNTVVGNEARASAADGSRRDDAPLRAGDPIRVEVAPRGPHGYHGALSRTFVVESDGGWARRAYVAVESALDAALRAIESGASVDAVAREARAELAAFGFDVAVRSDGGSESGADASDAESGAPDGADASVRGVGLSRREAPTDRGGPRSELRPGAVVAVAPRASDSTHGTVRLGDLVVVTDEGYERLGDGERSFAPRA